VKSDFSIYANGVPSFSPILDGTALRFISSTAPVPRVGLIAFSQPWAGGRNAVGVFPAAPDPRVGLIALSQPWAGGRNAVGVFPAAPDPRVGLIAFSQPGAGGRNAVGVFPAAPNPKLGLISFGQPRAEGHKPVGLMDSNTNGISSFLSLSSPYANGVQPSSPGLRGTRYPGTPAAHEFQPQRGCGPYVSSRALETERTATLATLDGFLTGLGYLK